MTKRRTKGGMGGKGRKDREGKKVKNKKCGTQDGKGGTGMGERFQLAKDSIYQLGQQDTIDS